MSGVDLTVNEARAVLVADTALHLSFEARAAAQQLLSVPEFEAWTVLLSSAKARIVDAKFATPEPGRAAPWEELHASPRMFGVFNADGYSNAPLAIFRDEASAHQWIKFQLSLGDECRFGNADTTVCPVDLLTGVVWNSHKPPPEIIE